MDRVIQPWHPALYWLFTLYPPHQGFWDQSFDIGWGLDAGF